MITCFKYSLFNRNACKCDSYVFNCIKTFIFYMLNLALLLPGGCKEEYNPPVKAVETNNLVVEGFINAQGSTNITLSRASLLQDTAVSNPEKGASIAIMGEDNSTILLSEDTLGHYRSDSVSLNKNQKYRLQIQTGEGKLYQSDFLSVKKTAPIDSVSWRDENNGVNIYVNSHDKPENSRYYKWTYEETWAIRSQWAVLSGYVNRNVSARNTEETLKMYYCWHSQNSSAILQESTARLSDNIISMIPLVNIPHYEEQLRIRYSILVKQVALDKQAYEFYQVMKKNTETTGSVFAPLPTDLSTNMHCVSDPAEKVIGYMSVSTEESKRIFISHDDIPGWNYQSLCVSEFVDISSSEAAFSNNGFIPYATKTEGLNTLGFYASTEECMDCRTRGSNVKPDFW